VPDASFLIKPASSLCNMKCKYCFYTDEADNRTVRSHGIMDEKCTRQLVKRAYEYAEGSCSFVFQGGEPTLAGIKYFESFVSLCREFNTKNVKTSFSLQTNGYDITTEMARFFHDNGFLIGLSLDGYDEIHNFMRCDSYKRVMDTARMFDKAGVEYNILSVVNNYSARHGAKIYNFFKKNGFKYLQFIAQVDPFSNTYDFSLTPKRYAVFLKTVFDLYYSDFMSGNYISIRNFDNYVRIMAGIPAECCGMMGRCSCNFTVESDGSVYPCDFYALDEWKLGNIFDCSFEQMKNSDTSQRFVQSSLYINEKCRECRHFNICMGGCRRLREPFYDGKPSLNRFCKSYEEFFDYSRDRLKEMAKICFK